MYADVQAWVSPCPQARRAEATASGIALYSAGPARRGLGRAAVARSCTDTVVRGIQSGMGNTRAGSRGRARKLWQAGCKKVPGQEVPQAPVASGT